VPKGKLIHPSSKSKTAIPLNWRVEFRKSEQHGKILAEKGVLHPPVLSFGTWMILKVPAAFFTSASTRSMDTVRQHLI